MTHSATVLGTAVSDLDLTSGALMMLRERYLRRDERERIVETPGEMMDRVAAYVAAAEDAYHAGTSDVWGEEFARRLRALEFLPNSPTLMNAGTGIGVLSACFVLPVEDSLESIFATLGHAAVLHQAGAGTGFSFSRLRPAGDLVASTHGRSSGPVSFMRVYDLATEVIRQSGRRRGANMAVLDVSHPDIHEFITAKSVPGELEHFNLSVGVSDRFMHAALAGEMHDLVNPRTGRVVDHISAAQLLDLIASEAWNTGEPGLLFLDRINRSNPLPSSGRIEATNPCGEVPLLPNESCNLGSINLAKFVDRDRRTVDWHGLRAITRVAVRFLDDVIDVNVYPTRILADAARETRKIGLGVMGLAELLAALGVPYDSDEAIDLGERVATCIHDEATKASAQLAAKRGAFPCFERSIYAAHACPPLRNAQLTAIAPTGTISLIAGTTSGIEPIFAIAYARNIMGEHLVESNQLFEWIAREEGFYSEELIARIAHTGSVSNESTVPTKMRRAFVTALEIEPGWHLRMQAAMQHHVDASVSKTVNLPATASVAEVRALLVDAWRLGLKGTTVYRYGSRPGQVLTMGEDDREQAQQVRVDTSFAGGCARPPCEF